MMKLSAVQVLMLTTVNNTNTSLEYISSILLLYSIFCGNSNKSPLFTVKVPDLTKAK